MKEHNNRKKADKFAEYITSPSLRRYLAAKVKQYAGTDITIFDGASGSGQLAQYIDCRHLTAVEIQQEACDALKENFPTATVTCDSFFNYQSDEQADCAIMNPPFSLKFKDLSTEEQANIQTEFSWKKSGVVDDIFVLKSLKYTKRFGVYILSPGVGYRKTETMFRKLIGNQLVELNMVRNGFEDTAIEVILIVVDKQKETNYLKREIFDCKTETVVFKDETDIDFERWEQPTEPIEQEVIEIDVATKGALEDDYRRVKSCVEQHLFMVELEQAYCISEYDGLAVDVMQYLERLRQLVDDAIRRMKELIG